MAAHLSLTDLDALPDFPTKCLTPWLRNFVEALAVETQTPTGLVGPMCLAVVATTVQRKVCVRVRQGWSEPLNIWMVAALPPGMRKSGVFTRAVRPVGGPRA
jgi:hypothetical protein